MKKVLAGHTLEGFLYVVAIIDLFSRKVIGYAMADHMKTVLVVSVNFPSTAVFR